MALESATPGTAAACSRCSTAHGPRRGSRSCSSRSNPGTPCTCRSLYCCCYCCCWRTGARRPSRRTERRPPSTGQACWRGCAWRRRCATTRAAPTRPAPARRRPAASSCVARAAAGTPSRPSRPRPVADGCRRWCTTRRKGIRSTPGATAAKGFAFFQGRRPPWAGEAGGRRRTPPRADLQKDKARD